MIFTEKCDNKSQSPFVAQELFLNSYMNFIGIMPNDGRTKTRVSGRGSGGTAPGNVNPGARPRWRPIVVSFMLQSFKFVVSLDSVLHSLQLAK